MPTMNEMAKHLDIILFHRKVQDSIDQIRDWAREAGIDTVEFILTFSERNKSVNHANHSKPNKTETEYIPEKIEGISYVFTKHPPRWHLAQMKDSAWYKAGCPGLYEEKIDQAIDTINGDDALLSSPPMCELSWSEVKDYGRDGFMVIMIKKFHEFSRKNGIQIVL
jgi:hypothetical protein